MREVSYAQAVREAFQEEFRRDDKYIYMGTSVPPQLIEEFGDKRMRMTPISESAFVGAAVGLAGSGFRPVADIRMATFGFVAMDQMVNQAAKITYMFGGQARFPIVYLMTVGAGRSMAAQHETSPYSLYMNVSGLKVVLPATPYDAKGLLKSALRDNNPVMFFQHVALSEMNGQIPDEDYRVPLGQAKVARSGGDVTVVALARMVHEALAAAAEAEKQGISVEVVDPRSLVPLDMKTIRESVHKTGRLVVVDEACPTCGAAAEISSQVVQDGTTWLRLRAAPKLVTGLNVPIPYSPPMEKFAIPDKERILATIKEVMSIPASRR